MAKKKVNPNRIPIAANSIDIQQIVNDASDKMVLQAWALILGALADFSDTTTDSLLHLWNTINSFQITICTHDEIAAEIKKIEDLTGLKIPFKQVTSIDIKTQGDLERCKRKAEQNALYSSLGLIACPIMAQKLLPEDVFIRVFRKVFSLDEEISLGKNGRVSLDDILEILKDEYSLILFESDGHTILRRLNDSPAQNSESSLLLSTKIITHKNSG